MLSKRYSVPPARLADLNGVTYQEGLPAGSRFKIPVSNYNFIRIESVVNSRPIYYRTNEEDGLRDISHMVNVSQSTIQRWNRMDDPELMAGQVLHVGWVAYDKTQVPFSKDTGAARPVIAPPAKSNPPLKDGTGKPIPAAKTVARPVKDTIAHLKDTIDTPDGIEEHPEFAELYAQQTAGRQVNEEAGAAVFYRLGTKAEPGVYYAFHNTAAKGTIIKIRNPASGNMIYAKVVGTLPKLKEYHNAIIGISNNAIGALGARDKRMFCKLKYR
jgi:hypothetical protein